MNNIYINTSENENKKYILTDVKEDTVFDIVIEKNSSLSFSIFTNVDIQKININVQVKENGVFNGYFADFSLNKLDVNVCVTLLENGATCNWNLATLSSNSDSKQFDVSVYHKSPSTYARMDNYGVCKDDAKLIFSGISYIEKGSYSSKTHQNAKIMVFDQNSNAKAKPVLKIDENDIEASHAAIVGKVNDEHLFYLTSRGLSESQAKDLITLGYLKPILKGFESEDAQELISNTIQERM